MSVKKRGFALWDPKKQHVIARLGGKAVHAKGTAHTFSHDEAVKAGHNAWLLKKYYSLLKAKTSDGFRLATIFTYQANEDDSLDMLDVDVFAGEGTAGNQDSREFLENCIKDYNTLYGTNYSTERFYDYYRDLQKRIKNKEVDLVLVVNMFLTGFDSPRLNTLFVDKNLRYHGLIQAYSRTNRLLNSDKPHGNIISFRNLKLATDKALALFGDENAKEIVFKKPYEEQKKEFENKLAQLRETVPTVDAVDLLQGEQAKAVFVKTFRDLLRIKSLLETFAEFSFDGLGISEQEFYDYQSKYLDIHEEQIRIYIFPFCLSDTLLILSP
jgi:type I restriction enzyme R subunit